MNVVVISFSVLNEFIPIFIVNLVLCSITVDGVETSYEEEWNSNWEVEQIGLKFDEVEKGRVLSCDYSPWLVNEPNDVNCNA